MPVQHKDFAPHPFLLLTNIYEPYAITTRKWPKSSEGVTINFNPTEDGGGRFTYRCWPEYLASLFFALPLTGGWIYFLLFPLIMRTVPFSAFRWWYLLLVGGYPLLVLATTWVHFPILNLHWLVTKIRTLHILPGRPLVLCLGFFPFSFRKTIARSSVEKIILLTHKNGIGLGYLYHWFTVCPLNSLYLVTKDKRRHCLACNETKGGWLSDCGRELADCIGVPFAEQNTGMLP